MTDDASANATVSLRPIHAVAAAIAIGIVAGLLEGAVIKVGSAILHLPTGGLAPLELFWMAPIAATSGLLVVALALVALDRPVRAWFGRPLLTLTVPILVAISMYSAIRSLRLGVAWYAATVLAIGVGAVVARLLRHRPRLTERTIPRAVPWMIAVLLMYGVSIAVIRRIDERRALATLPAAGKTPNVLVVVWDAVRHLDLSLYGYDRHTTPALDRFAAGGLVFDRAFTTAPWSLPSHASILTGRYPQEMTTGHRQPLDGSLPLISEVLDQHGYATGGFVGNPYWLQPDFGLSRGFTAWDAQPALTVRTIISTWWLAKTAWETVAHWRGDHTELVRRRATDVNASLVSWIKRRGNRPFFAFVNYFDAHEPYLPPAPYDTLFAPRNARYWHDEAPRAYSARELSETRAVYDEAIRYLDATFQSLLDQLQVLGELQNTVVILTADHGEEFGEHDPSLIAHSLILHTTSTLIPLVIVYPPRLQGGRRIVDPVSLRDIPATIMDLIGAPTGHPFPGVSLAGYGGDSTTRPPPTPRVMTVEKKKTGNLPSWTANNGNLYSVVDGHLQYILDAQSKDQLFDLTNDIWERTNLADRPEMLDTVARMRALLDSLVRGPDGKLRPRAPAKGAGFGGGKFIRRR